MHIILKFWKNEILSAFYAPVILNFVSTLRFDTLNVHIIPASI
jgi:hypothetical protein